MIRSRKIDIQVNFQFGLQRKGILFTRCVSHTGYPAYGIEKEEKQEEESYIRIIGKEELWKKEM